MLLLGIFPPIYFQQSSQSNYFLELTFRVLYSFFLKEFLGRKVLSWDFRLASFM